MAVRFQCRYVRAGVRCERPALRGWTMCVGHYSAGMNRRQWQRIRASEEGRRGHDGR